MSSKIEDINQNGWDINDDNEWDDWGDAEDNMAEETVANASEGVARTSNEASAPSNSNTVLDETKNSKLDNISRENSHVQDQTTQCAQSSGWGSLFGGVVSSVLSTATDITTTVSHGLDKVIGVPDPAELARINLMEAKSQEVSQQPNNAEKRSLTTTNPSPVFGMGLVSNVTSLGSKVLNTGLDTLEGIGKKTMNILQENDPLLKDKIKKLGLEHDKPNLSEVLKEAKQENEQLEQSLMELNLEKSRAQLRFEVLFENNCGLVHLEALEILSKESNLKIQALKESVSGKALEEIIETVNEVKELMELEDLDVEPENEEYTKDELNNIFNQAMEDTGLQIQFEEITNLWSNCLTWFDTIESINIDIQTVFAEGINCLAGTCAYEILKLHKIAELLLVKNQHSTANEVDAIVQLCKHFSVHLQTVANRFAFYLSKSPDQEEANTHINRMFAEMLQARQQIEKAYHLFLPILQIGAV